MRLTENFLGTRYVGIAYSARGRTRRVSIPEVMDFAVEGIRATRRSTRPMCLHNTAHPVNPTLALARGTSSTYADHGMRWDNTGKNGHYSSFNWP